MDLQQRGNAFEIRGQMEPLRWYVLLWLGLVYFWGVRSIWTWGLMNLEKMCAALGRMVNCPHVAGSQANLALGEILRLLGASAPLRSLLAPSVLLFTALMLLQAFLLFWYLASQRSRTGSLLYLVAQAGGALVLGLLLFQVGTTVLFSLYLLHILVACAVLKHLRTIILCSLAYLLLAVVSLVIMLNTGPQIDLLTGETAAPFPVQSALLLFLGGFALVYIHLIRSSARLTLAHEQLAEAHQQLHTSHERIRELTMLHERQRLARELHDTLAQGLSGVILHLGVATACLEASNVEETRAILHATLHSARETLTNARSAIDDLRTLPVDPAAFAAVLQAEAQRFTTATGIPCLLELHDLPMFPPVLSEQIQRAISEGLTNIARHAHASHAWIALSCEDGQVLCEIGDDGQGCEVTAMTAQQGHYGLLGLRERARLAGGHVDFFSVPQEGTRLRLSLPVSREKVST